MPAMHQAVLASHFRDQTSNQPFTTHPAQPTLHNPPCTTHPAQPTLHNPPCTTNQPTSQPTLHDQPCTSKLETTPGTWCASFNYVIFHARYCCCCCLPVPLSGVQSSAEAIWRPGPPQGAQQIVTPHVSTPAGAENISSGPTSGTGR
jgi:hypothetical protein